MPGFASRSTNKEPEILKKSNAIPYTIIDRTRSHKPEPGFPIPNNPNRNTHASMLISITCFIPNRLKKNGIARMKRVSDICESEIRILLCFTAKLSAYSGTFAKSPKNGLPNMFVICNAAPKNIANKKNFAIIEVLNN